MAPQISAEIYAL